MNQYIITEEQLKTILERRGAIYISCQGKFRDEIVNEVRSHPYNPQAERERVLDEIEKELRSGKCPPGLNNFNCGDSDCSLCIVEYVRNNQSELREGKGR